MLQQRPLSLAGNVNGSGGRQAHERLPRVQYGRSCQQATNLLQRLSSVTPAQAEAGKSFGDTVKGFARQIQGALPIVGLLSRLTSTAGGVGRDDLAYPEFARQLLDRADQEFNSAVKEWEAQYGRVGQRKYVVAFLWMAFTGLGIVPPKGIADAAMRLRVTHDLTDEVECFEYERQQALSVYSYVERPQGKLADQISIAVDALCRLSIGLEDGQAIPERDKRLIIPIVYRTFSEIDGAAQLSEEAVSDAARKQRKNAYA